MAEVKQYDEPRLFVWCVPRSTSTALYRAMSNKAGIKLFMQPYMDPGFFGPERISTRFKDTPIKEGRTFAKIREELEAPYPGISCVFGKEVSFLIQHVESITESFKQVAPSGYTVAFLIRNPVKCVRSFHKCSTDQSIGTGFQYFDPKEVGYDFLYEIFQYVTEELHQEAIVIDSDDLLEHPESILREFCAKIGIEFEDTMVNWTNDVTEDPQLVDWTAWCKTAMTTKTLSKEHQTVSAEITTKTDDEDPGIVRKSIEYSMPFYKKMYAHRIVPKPLPSK